MKMWWFLIVSKLTLLIIIIIIIEFVDVFRLCTSRVEDAVA